MKRIVLTTFLLLLPIVGYTQQYIRIGSFNIAELGEGNHASKRDEKYIANMLRNANLDLIGIQEVGVNDGGETQIDRIIELMSNGGNEYYWYILPQTGDERTAFIYRDPIIVHDEIYWLDDDKDPSNPGAGGKKYFRIPAAVEFQAGNFDFLVVNVHFAWGNLNRRKSEVKALKKYLRAHDPYEDDYIIIGDMNRYGKYNKGSTGKAFDELLKGNWKRRYRFPLLEAITEPDNMKVYQAATDAQSTTIAKSKNLYDQIIITAGAYNEFEADSPVLGTNVGIVAFDMESRFNGLGHNAIKYRVSDHRPIWARFRIDLQDDD